MIINRTDESIRRTDCIYRPMRLMERHATDVLSAKNLNGGKQITVPIAEQGWMKMSAELCKTCIHTKVCMKTKNILGNVFVPGNPILFDNEELWAEYKKWEDAGFPCGDYMEVDDG